MHSYSNIIRDREYNITIDLENRQIILSKFLSDENKVIDTRLNLEEQIKIPFEEWEYILHWINYVAYKVASPPYPEDIPKWIKG